MFNAFSAFNAVLNTFGALIQSDHGRGLLYIMIVLPALLALMAILIPARLMKVRITVFLSTLILNLAGALGVIGSDGLRFTLPWAGFGIDISLRIYDFSAFIIICIAAAALLAGIYSTVFFKDKSLAAKDKSLTAKDKSLAAKDRINDGRSFFFFYLLTVALANGAVLANNLVIMLFFWEGLLITLFAMILTGGKRDTAASMKALVLCGASDLLLMLGIAVTFILGGTFEMDALRPAAIEGLGMLGFACMALGALGKAGAMPFHSWIPDAAKSAPVPFMAFLPGALEKLLGIYLLVRVTTDFYALMPGSMPSTVLMSIGAVTIIFAVAMALIQKI